MREVTKNRINNIDMVLDGIRGNRRILQEDLEDKIISALYEMTEFIAGSHDYETMRLELHLKGIVDDLKDDLYYTIDNWRNVEES